MLTKDEFVKRAHEAHPGENLDYTKADYKGFHVKVCIIDHDINPETGKEYGEYWQEPAKHLKGQSHPDKAANKKMTKKEFVRRAKLAHPGENLDYSKAKFVNTYTKVCIIDHDINPETGKEYGEFWQTPKLHMRGQSNPLKKKYKISKSETIKQDEFIKRAKEAHKDEDLDYSDTVYTGMHNPVIIRDKSINPETGKEYGYFEQIPYAHLYGCGHPRHGKMNAAQKRLLTQEEFLEKAKEAHPDGNFDFSMSVYKGMKNKILIHCLNKFKNGKEHGILETTPEKFLNYEYGCPYCAKSGISNEETEVYQFIASLIGEDKIERSRRDILPNNKQLDMFISSMNIAIEFDGLFWHSTGSPSYKGNMDLLWKTRECQKLGIRLIHIFEDEWDKHPEIVKDKLSYILGCSKEKKKIGARKCLIRAISKSESDSFLEMNHIQGKASASVYLGAFYQGKLVSVMLFKKTGKDNEYELNRFASDNSYVIQGIASKLLKYFLKMNLAKSIISFADRRWTDESNNVYSKLGFNACSIVKPTYWYIKRGGLKHRFHKFNFRKKTLIQNNPEICLSDMSELQMTQSLGYFRIYDCGLIKYKLPIQQ